MKFKTTLIIFVVFVALLAFVLLFESKTTQKKEYMKKIVSLSQENITKIAIDSEEDTVIFEKTNDGTWLITSPIKTSGDQAEINNLASQFSDLMFERIVEETPEDLGKYGIPQIQISIYTSDKADPEKILIGMENPLDNTFFAKKEGEMRIVLLSSSFKNILEKKLMDFRNKIVFKFRTDDVQSITASTRSTDWTVVKTDEEWFLEKPVSSLANSSHFENLLLSLSNLQAQEFVSEDKTEEALEETGLNKPDFLITLHMLELDTETVFTFHTVKDRTYAASSSSPKIIRVDQSILDTLDMELRNLRERRVGGFYSWEVSKMQVLQDDLSLFLAKDEDGIWQFIEMEGAAVNREKIDRFIRFFETTEATEMIDPPLDLADFGLDPPQGEMTFWIDEGKEQEKEVSILIGKKVEDIEQVYVKNKRFEYLFRINASFLDDIPKDPADWISKTNSEEK